MGRIGHLGTWPGDNAVIDRAGWQCQDNDLDGTGQRCRLIASYTHRRRHGDHHRVVALCPRHYELAGPEAVRY